MKSATDIRKPEFAKDGELFFLRKSTNEEIGKIDIEISDDEDKSETGMMYRSSIGENQGMLFILKGNSEQSFWMKNTLIPLDVIFANSSKRIIKIYKKTEPLSSELLPSENPVKYTIELKGGYCERTGVAEGDMISYSTDF